MYCPSNQYVLNDTSASSPLDPACGPRYSNGGYGIYYNEYSGTPFDYRIVTTDGPYVIGGNSYTWNFTRDKMAGVPNPGAMMLLADTVSVDCVTPGVPRTGMYGHERAYFDTKRLERWSTGIYLSHSNRSNVLCYDGHAEPMAAKDMRNTLNAAKVFLADGTTNPLTPGYVQITLP